MELSDSSLEELYKLKKDCDFLIKKQKQEKNIALLSKLKNSANELTITDRVHNFYEKNYIETFDFLYESMVHATGGNIKRLYYYTLISSNSEMVERFKSFGIYNENDYFSKLYRVLNKPNTSDEVIKLMKDTKKIINLYYFFLDFENVINHQSVFYMFKYISDTLNKILVDKNEDDFDLINKNMEEKSKILYDNFTDLVAYLLEIRNSKENARLAICNIGLNKVKDIQERVLTYNERSIIKAVAFGTTLDKIKNGNYEDSKNLIFVPCKKNG